MTVVCPETGPETIESAYDEAHAIPPTLALFKQVKQEEVQGCGMGHFLAFVRNLDLTVAETTSDPVHTKQRIFEEAEKAVHADGAEVIIHGCAGMAGYASELEARLNIKQISGQLL